MKKLMFASFLFVVSSSVYAQNAACTTNCWYVGAGYTSVDIDGIDESADGFGFDYLGIANGQVIYGLSAVFSEIEGIDLHTQSYSIGYALQPLNEGSVYFDVFLSRAQIGIRGVEDLSEFGASVGYGQMGGDGNEWKVNISTLDGETTAAGMLRIPIQNNAGITFGLALGSDATGLNVGLNFRF